MIKPNTPELEITANRFREIMEQSYQLFIEKNNHHQNKFLKHGLPGMMVRIDDKIGDVNVGGKPGETVIESLLDIANYAILAVIVIEEGDK